MLIIAPEGFKFTGKRSGRFPVTNAIYNLQQLKVFTQNRLTRAGGINRIAISTRDNMDQFCIRNCLDDIGDRLLKLIHPVI
jgi:hypothetical protein